MSFDALNVQSYAHGGILDNREGVVYLGYVIVLVPLFLLV